VFENYAPWLLFFIGLYTDLIDLVFIFIFILGWHEYFFFPFLFFYYLTLSRLKTWRHIFFFQFVLHGVIPVSLIFLSILTFNIRILKMELCIYFLSLIYMKSSQSHGLGHDEVARVDFNYFLSYFFFYHSTPSWLKIRLCNFFRFAFHEVIIISWLGLAKIFFLF
jgi:hypothetical protein